MSNKKQLPPPPPVLPTSISAAPISLAPTSTFEDLEDTAELPGLAEALAQTDTWVVPQFAGAPVLDDVIRAHEEEIGTLRVNLAAVTESRSHLELDLHGLTTNLRELESHLHTKSEQLSRFEREVTARDRRVVELEKDLATRLEQLSVGTSERDELRARCERAQYEVAQIAQLRERQAAVQAEAEHDRGRREYALLQSQTESTELKRRLAAHHEALQHGEGRHHIFDAMLREREQLLDERDTKLRGVQAELATQKRGVSNERTQLAGELVDTKARIAQAERASQQAREDLVVQSASTQQARAVLEAQLATTLEQHQQSQARALELQASVAAAAAHIAELEAQQIRAQQRNAVVQVSADAALARIAALEQESGDHADGLHTLHEQLRLAHATNETLRGDLAAAEDLIRTSESELRQRESRLARLESNELALRSKLEAVGRSLDERNALIARLETEAASSVAVLGSIQNNLERLDQATATQSADSRPAAAPVVDAPVRLLIRVDGRTGARSEDGTGVRALGHRTTIGRTPDNDLCIDADFISRHHAVVLVTVKGTIVEDLNSTNGVFVNNIRVTRRRINENDLLTFGKTSFRYTLRPIADPT